MNKPIGISILTNGSRREWLQRCIATLLSNCYYRPLVIGIYDNGSTDDTSGWIRRLRDIYGVEWRIASSDKDLGCARGTNASIELVSDCELQIHLESDFELLLPNESGEDKMWLHRAIKHMESGDCDYLYLRRMRDHNECLLHWWSQWMPKITEERKEFLKCPNFWWSNNPVLFRTKVLKDTGVLPLDESKDGEKGTSGWSQPELQARRPPNTWIHRWGVFIHEREQSEDFSKVGCRRGLFGASGCKYGFWLNYEKARFCKACDWSKSFRDLPNHEIRFHANMAIERKTVAFHSNQLGYRGTEVGSWNYAKYNEELLGNRSVFIA